MYPHLITIKSDVAVRVSVFEGLYLQASKEPGTYPHMAI